MRDKVTRQCVKDKVTRQCVKDKVTRQCVRDKVTRQCPQTTTFEEIGEPKQIRTEVPLLTSLKPYRYAKTLGDIKKKRRRLLSS